MRFARARVGASAASMFILDRGGVLRGLVSEWDWTRTSFASNLREWPTVARALAGGDAHAISRENAAAAEAVWFEPRGIERTLCVPLCTEGHPIGVLFFDFDSSVAALDVDVAFLTDVGRRCARALGRAPSDARSRKSGEGRGHGALVRSSTRSGRARSHLVLAAPESVTHAVDRSSAT